jgi:hypothetical protein
MDPITLESVCPEEKEEEEKELLQQRQAASINCESLIIIKLSYKSVIHSCCYQQHG